MGLGIQFYFSKLWMGNYFSLGVEKRFASEEILGGCGSQEEGAAQDQSGEEMGGGEEVLDGVFLKK